MLYGISIADGATMTVAGGAIVKSVDGLTVGDGATLTATSATFTSLEDDSAGGDTNGDGGASSPGSWPGIEALQGSTVTISSSTIRNASVGVNANPYWMFDQLTPWADVSVEGSAFEGNMFDVKNGPKDWGPIVDEGGIVSIEGKPVNAEGATLDPNKVSSHEHLCQHPTEPLLQFPIRIWDVEFGNDDGSCPFGWREIMPHL